MFFGKKAQDVEQLKVVVIGAGEVGFYIAQRLSEERKQVVVIDQKPESLQRLEDALDVHTVLGSGSSPGVLLAAGSASADIFLAVTDSDEVNILACLFAKAIAPKAIQLARIRDTEYTDYPELLKAAGLDIHKLVNPEEEIVHTIDRLLTLPGAIEYGEFANHRICMVSMHVDAGPLVGQPLIHFRQIVQDDGIMVAAIGRGDTLIIPTGQDVIEMDDVVYFVYRDTSLRALLAALHRERGMINSVFVVGGGNVGRRLAKLFESKDIAVKLIESNAARCELLAEELDTTLVLRGDGTDKSLLAEEYVTKTGAFIAVTGDEESNILSCLLAKSMGVKETVARVNKAAYFPLMEAIGIAHSVSTRLSAVNSILHYVRQGKVLISMSVGNDAAEVLEVLLAEDSLLVGGTLMELNVPRGSLLLAVLRGDEVFIPTGSTVFEAWDHIVLLVLRGEVNAVETWLTQEV